MPHETLNAIAHVVGWIFLFAFGACVGSFLNVVIYRLPEGRSVVSPPSRCPGCGAMLPWYDNLPVVGWILLRGRCRRCRMSISAQYPLVEFLIGGLFVAIALVFYELDPDTWWGAITTEWWFRGGFARTWPAYVLLAFLIAALFAMTVIDARTFLIPIQIPNVIVALAFVLWPLQAILPSHPVVVEHWPIPLPAREWTAASLGALLGIGASGLLIWRGILRQSFADYDDFVEEGDTLGDYPHARREMGIELLYLVPIAAGAAIGWLVAVGIGFVGAVGEPTALDALGGAVAGYLVGGGVVWAVRILGTLAFGREAMGMGDVHLLGAVGAVLGWIDPIWIFFVAPFSGLLFALTGGVMARVTGGVPRVLPYGPHLAVATLAIIFLRPVFLEGQSRLLPDHYPVPGETARSGAARLRVSSASDAMHEARVRHDGGGATDDHPERTRLP